LARSLIAASFQNDRSFDPNGVNIEIDLLSDGACLAAVGVLRIYEYYERLPSIERKKLSQNLDFEIILKNLNLRMDFLTKCPKFQTLINVRARQRILFNKGIRSETRFNHAKNNISEAFEANDPDSIYQAAILFYSLLSAEDRVAEKNQRLFARALNEAASLGHVNSMVNFYDLFSQNEQNLLRIKAANWLKRAISLRSDAALIRCVFDRSIVFTEIKNDCFNNISNKNLVMRVAQVRTEFQKLSEPNVTRDQVIFAHTSSGILKRLIQVLEW